DESFMDLAKALGGDQGMFELSGPGDQFIVKGKRESESLITISKTAQHDPYRDASILEVVLSTSLDEKTLLILSELLYSRHIAPLQKQMMSMNEARAQAKKSTKK